MRVVSRPYIRVCRLPLLRRCYHPATVILLNLEQAVGGDIRVGVVQTSNRSTFSKTSTTCDV